MKPRKHRHICYDPEVTFFKPHGIPMSQLEIIELNDEELEALRLKNVENLEQIAAAERMNTSQSTFQRLLTSAYTKVSLALTSGKAIQIKRMDRPARQFECWQCKHAWEEPFGNGKQGCEMTCPKCGSPEIHRTDCDGHGFGNQPWGYKQNNRK